MVRVAVLIEGWVGDGGGDCSVGMKVYSCIVSGVLGLSGEARLLWLVVVEEVFEPE